MAAPVVRKPYGLRDGTVQFVQDGVSITDANLAALTTRPPGMDTIQEYRVEMSVPSAKYSSAATTLISTRSGTNDFHGSLFYTGRNNGFGIARQREDFFTKPPQLIRNEYGASIGGPVRLPHIYNGKDRTFFFFAWEGYSLRSGSTISTNLPTACHAAGQLQPTHGRPEPADHFVRSLDTGGRSAELPRAPFPGNIIPLARRSPFAGYFYSVMPQPNQPDVNPSVAANWFGPDPSPAARLDQHGSHRPSLSRQRPIYGRYTVGNRTR